jgi:hypothetical protein
MLEGHSSMILITQFDSDNLTRVESNTGRNYAYKLTDKL